MGMNLRPEIIGFLLEKMRRHGVVTEAARLADDTNYIYRIERNRGYCQIQVWLADDYCFTMDSYYTKPIQTGSGDFILIARPEGCATPQAVEQARLEGITIGHIGHLMGALNFPSVAVYVPPEQRERKATGPSQP